MRSKSLLSLGLIASLLFLLIACHKDAAPVQTVLNEQQKKDLIARVQADTLFKQYKENALKTHQAVTRGVTGVKVDVPLLKESKPKSEKELIDAYKKAGVQNCLNGRCIFMTSN